MSARLGQVGGVMAIYHLSAKVISRSSGRSSVGAAAYRAGERLTNQHDGTTHDFRRKQGVAFSEIMLPEAAPLWMQHRQKLWNAVEVSEARVNARTARELVLALPCELSPREQVELLRGFVREQCTDRGMVADLNLHEADSPNPHAHVLLTTRAVTASGFGAKVRDWNRVELLHEWREAWAEHVNAALAESGSTARVDHRTLSAQGIQHPPSRHHGVIGAALQRRDRGQHSLTQPLTPQETGQTAQNFDTAFMAAMAKPISRALLADMDMLNARTHFSPRQHRL